MKILLFHPLTGHLWRGIERTTVSLASSLAVLEQDVSILTIRHPERALLGQLDQRVNLWEVPHFRYYSYSLAVPFFASHLIKHQYDAIIAFFGGFGVGPALALATRIRETRYFLCPCYPVDLVPHRYREFERWGLPARSSGIWAPGPYVARQASKRFRLPVTPLPQGVDTDRFREHRDLRSGLRLQMDIAESDPVILTVAALNERKGIQHVLHALPRIRHELPDVKYLIAGEGDYRAHLQALIDSLGLHGTAYLLGARDDVESLYAAADVFCLLSYGEADPMVVYESLASGVPLAVLDCPPFPQIIPEDLADFVPSTNPQEIADALMSLLDDHARRAHMSVTGRRFVAKHHSFEIVARRILDLLQISPPKGPSNQPLVPSEPTSTYTSVL